MGKSSVHENIISENSLDSLVSKAPTVHSWGPEFRPPGWLYTAVTPTPGCGDRKIDCQNSLASLTTCMISGFSKRPHARKGGGVKNDGEDTLQWLLVSTHTHTDVHTHTLCPPHSPTHTQKKKILSVCLFVFYVWRAPLWNYSCAFLDFQCWNLTFLFLQCMWPKYLTLHVIYLYHDNIILHMEMLKASFVTLRRKAKDTMAVIYHPLLPRPSPRRILHFSCSESVKASLLFLHYLLWIPTPSLYSLFFPFHVSSLKADTHLLHASTCLSTWGMLGASRQTLNMDYLKQNASVLLVQV